MRLILREDIKGLGRKFDVKEVKDGYARNFLIPRGLVEFATDSKIEAMRAKILEQEKEEEKLKEKLGEWVKALAAQELEFYVKTGRKGEIFGSVTKEDIEARIRADFDSENLKIHLEKPIKTIGDHVVQIELGKGIKTKITIRLSEEKS
ncbi:50S ribosomal protein L9 [Candidatus Wolfebacteria bacterium]|nr:50S ribosomal protein L9 [Candidatus Wolfebacteria bacterium]